MCEQVVQTMLTIGQSGQRPRIQESRTSGNKPAFCTGNCQQCPGRAAQPTTALVEVERRSEHRRKRQVPINAFQTDLHSFGATQCWSSVDLSSGGVGIASDRPLEVGSTYVLSRGDRESFSRKATVVRCVRANDGYVIGFRWSASWRERSITPYLPTNNNPPATQAC